MKRMISSFEIANYRSIGEEGVRLDDMQKLNVLIGRNNSGKSNILSSLRLAFEALVMNRGQRNAQAQSEYHKENNQLQLHFAITLPFEDYQSKIEIGPEDIFLEWYYRTNGSTLRIAGEIGVGNYLDKTSGMMAEAYRKQVEGVVVSRDEHLRYCTEQYKRILDAYGPLPKLRSIHAHRNLTRTESFGLGEDLRAYIMRLLAPGRDVAERARKSLSELNSFIARLLNVDIVRVGWDDSGGGLYLEITEGGLYRSHTLSMLGSGVEQAVVFAVSAASSFGEVYLIEEPETYMHPAMQVDLLSYLYNSTANQYNFATHSAAIIDAARSSIFKVEMANGSTNVVSAKDSREIYELLSQLGYSQSMLLQTNFLLWVEGPSDRIYITNALKMEAPELVEGVHYSVLMYGGALLSHYCYEPADGLISIANIHRGSAIVCDSDRREAESSLKPAVERLRKEFEEAGRFVWITEGLEIENYIDWNTYSDLAGKMYKWFDSSAVGEGNHRRRTVQDKNVIDKVAFARKIVEGGSNVMRGDWNDRICGIIELIRQANSKGGAIQVEVA